VSRTLPNEAIEFIVGQEELLVTFTAHFMKSLVNGIKPEKVREALIARGIDAGQADAHIAIAAMACQAASRIKAGEVRDTVLNEMGFPPPVRVVFSKMVDAAIAESGEHDLQSFASRPGKVKLEPLHWIPRNLDMFGLIALFLLGPALLIFVLGVLFWKGLIVVALLFVAAFFFISYRMYNNARMHFLHAYLAPAKVVNLTPRMLATYSNLCNNDDVVNKSDCYVVKVEACDLTDAEFSKIGLGGFVACVCGFGPDSKDGQWDDVHPITVQTATGKNEVILKALQRISEEDWSNFDEALTYLTPEQRSTPGLYRVPAPAHELKAAGKPAPAPPRKTVAPEDDDLRLM